MGFIRRAAKNIIRVPGRSIMLGIVFIVVAILVMSGLSIYAGSQQGIVDARLSLGNEVNLTQNTSYMQQQMQSSGQKPQIDLTESMGKALTGLKYETGYDFNISMGTLGSLNPITVSASNSNNGTIKTQSAGQNSDSPQPTFRLIGDSDPAMSPDFSSGSNKITQGRYIDADDDSSNKDAAVISSALAQQNNLKLGDTFTIQSDNSDLKETLKVVGIYTPAQDNSNTSMPLPSFALQDNYIYTTYSTAREVDLDGVTGLPSDYVTSVYYSVDDPAHIDAFKKEAASKYDTTKYELDANDSTFQQLVGPLQKLSQFAIISIISTIVAAAIIIILMMLLNVTGRKYEVGILRSLGAKRFKVAAQFAAETFIICIIGLFIGGAVGGVTSQATASYLLNQNVVSQQQAQSQSQQGGVFIMSGGRNLTSSSNIKPIDKINAIISLNQLGELILIGLLLAVFGCLVSTYWIMKYEPMKILSNRN